jgi:hypothetical protein
VRARRDLGALPSELAELRWPEPPRIARDVEVRDAAALQRAIDVAGTRARVDGTIAADVVIHASDVEIVMTAASRVNRIAIDRGVRRVRIAGGEVGTIELLPPAWFGEGAPVWDESMFVEDVAIERVRARADDSAFVVRGRRVAVLECDARAERYALWAGDTGPLDASDLIVANGRFRSAGPESTLRMHDVVRSAVVGMVLENREKHDYRVHGRSDLALAARNVLVHTGMMIGTQPGDRVGTVIFEDNVLHHDVPSLLEIDPSAIRRLVMRRNVVYTDRWDAFYPYADVEPGWTIEANERLPFRAYAPR